MYKKILRFRRGCDLIGTIIRRIEFAENRGKRNGRQNY